MFPSLTNVFYLKNIHLCASIAKLSFNFNYILVESWDSLILTFNTHPASHHPTEKVVNHATSLNLYHLRPSSTPTLTSTKVWVEINVTIQFSNQPPNRKSSWTATLSTVSTPGFDYIFRLNCQLNLSLAQLSPSLFIFFPNSNAHFRYFSWRKNKLVLKWFLGNFKCFKLMFHIWGGVPKIQSFPNFKSCFMQETKTFRQGPLT